MFTFLSEYKSGFFVNSKILLGANDFIASKTMEVMENWHEKYKPKEIKPEWLPRIIKAGSRVFIGSGCSEPVILTEQLIQNKYRFADCHFIHFLTLSDNKFFDDREPTLFRHHALFIGEKLRDAVNEGKADYIPISLSDIPKLMRSGRLRVDVALIQVTPPDRFGFCSLGINVDINKTAAEVAKIVIAQINPNMPRTSGDSFIKIDNIHYFVYHESPLIEFTYPEIDNISDRIGKYIARIIENGSTIQFGIGTIPNAVLKHLKTKKNLAVYSEVLSDSVIDLIESGVVTCSKNVYPHIMTSFVMGTKRLYEFVNNNPFIEFHPTEFINSVFNIARNKKQVSINAALSVSITGQVNSDSIGYTFYSGVGGQADFTRGAALTEGGKPIICLPSTNRDETKSRIVAVLDPGAGVTITRSDVHYVVTEWGVAHLHGKSIRERVIQMIGIAHPKFRKELLDEAKRMKYVYQDQILPTTKDGVVVIYPEGFEWNYETKSLGSVFFRPVKPEDERLLQEMYYSLEDQDRILRFFAPKTSFPHKETQPSVAVDYDSTFVIVGIVGDEDNQRIIATGSYYLNRSVNLAEIAFTVTKDYRNQGLTRHMLLKLIEIAKEKGVAGFMGEVLMRNDPMMHILKSIPYQIKFEGVGDSFEFVFKFSDEKKLPQKTEPISQ